MVGIRAVNSGKDTLWIDGGWHTVRDKDGNEINRSNLKEGSVIDYAEVDSCNLSTFYNPSKGLSSPGNPTPYATTMLLGSNDCNVSNSITLLDSSRFNSFVRFINLKYYFYMYNKVFFEKTIRILFILLISFHLLMNFL